jgi:hypothetical protein
MLFASLTLLSEILAKGIVGSGPVRQCTMFVKLRSRSVSANAHVVSVAYRGVVVGSDHIEHRTILRAKFNLKVEGSDTDLVDYDPLAELFDSGDPGNFSEPQDRTHLESPLVVAAVCESQANYRGESGLIL